MLWSEEGVRQITPLLAELAAVRDAGGTGYSVAVGYSEPSNPRPTDLDRYRTAVGESGGEPEDHARIGLGVFRDSTHNGDRIRCQGQ